MTVPDPKGFCFWLDIVLARIAFGVERLPAMETFRVWMNPIAGGLAPKFGRTFLPSACRFGCFAGWGGRSKLKMKDER